MAVSREFQLLGRVEKSRRAPASGATAEFAEFCESNYAAIVGSLSLYCADRMLAEDLAQEALAAACRDWQKVRQHPSPQGWLHRAALNLANSYFRRKRAEHRVQQRLRNSWTEVHSDPDPATVISVRNAVARLPKRQRSALILRYFADLPTPVVASLMDCSVGTVKSLTNRAIVTLRRQLNDGEEEGESNVT
jgi:RNA polymerase sigma-70 factor (sigma-E family)